jgi:deoxyadenosine/deoxycytidine kinase
MIVGISGKIGSGKDTLAAMIQYHAFTSSRSHTWNLQMFLNSTPEPSKGSWVTFVISRFAGALKEIVALLTGCNVATLRARNSRTEATIDVGPHP